MSSPFEVTTRARRGIAAIVARSADVTNCGRFQTRGMANPAKVPPEWRMQSRLSSAGGTPRFQTAHRPLMNRYLVW